MKTLAQVEPRTPISSAPLVITNPDAYYLPTNLVGTSGTNGIVIPSGSVTLDLNGNALLGVLGSLEGILFSGNETNVTMRNGTVQGWGSTTGTLQSTSTVASPYTNITAASGPYAIVPAHTHLPVDKGRRLNLAWKGTADSTI